MPLLPSEADPALRALVLLLLLAREADLDVDQVDGPAARALVARGLARSAARRHRADPSGGRPWMCGRRWVAG